MPLDEDLQWVAQFFTVAPDELATLTGVIRQAIDDKVSQGTDGLMPMIHTISIPTDRMPEDGEKLDRQHRIHGLACNFNDADDKNAIMQRIAQQLCDDRQCPILVAMCSEAWVSRYEADDIPEDRPAPRNDPNRQEVLIVAGVTVQPRLSFNQFLSVSRDADNQLVPGEWSGLLPGEAMLLDKVFEFYLLALMEKRGDDELFNMFDLDDKGDDE